MKKVLFFTAFKDLGRGHWKGFERSADDYFKYFKNMVKGNLNLICFCEPEIEKRIRELGFEHCYPYDAPNTFFQYESNYQKIMNSPEYRKLSNNRKDPECVYASYNCVQHNKVIFLQRAKQLFPDYTHYAWIDFGYCRQPLTTTSYDFSTLPTNQIVYATFRIPSPGDPIYDPFYFLGNPQSIFQGGCFFVPSELVEWYLSIYTQYVSELEKMGVCDDDESVLMQIYKQYPNHFQLKILEWFKLLSTYTEPKCLVTAFFQMPSKRPFEFYMKTIERFLRSCQTHCIFFTSSELKHVFEAYKNPNITFVSMELDEFEAWKLGSDFWKRQISRDAEKYHTEPLGAIWYEKSHFVSKAAQQFPEMKVFVWIDAGCIRSDAEEIAFRQFGKRSYFNLEDDRIHLQLLEKIKTKEFYTYPDVSIAGAIIAGTLSAWKLHIELYNKILDDYDKAGISASSDQYVMKSCVRACPGLYVEHQVPEQTQVDRWFWFLEMI